MIGNKAYTEAAGIEIFGRGAYLTASKVDRNDGWSVK